MPPPAMPPHASGGRDGNNKSNNNNSGSCGRSRAPSARPAILRAIGAGRPRSGRLPAKPGRRAARSGRPCPRPQRRRDATCINIGPLSASILAATQTFVRTGPASPARLALTHLYEPLHGTGPRCAALRPALPLDSIFPPLESTNHFLARWWQRPPAGGAPPLPRARGAPGRPQRNPVPCGRSAPGSSRPAPISPARQPGPGAPSGHPVGLNARRPRD